MLLRAPSVRCPARPAGGALRCSHPQTSLAPTYHWPPKPRHRSSMEKGFLSSTHTRPPSACVRFQLMGVAGGGVTCTVCTNTQLLADAPQGRHAISKVDDPYELSTHRGASYAGRSTSPEVAQPLSFTETMVDKVLQSSELRCLGSRHQTFPSQLRSSARSTDSPNTHLSGCRRPVHPSWERAWRPGPQRGIC